ncbi:MAG: hypothetical protein JOZ99_02695 [Actinobacteria bacterium]|nr:hypothetical protein [Actinomycetota bacterium]
MNGPSIEEAKPTYSRLFWPCVLVGWGLIANGVRGVLENSRVVRASAFLRVFIGALLVHDVLLAPFVIAVGVMVARIVPRRVRAPVQAGLIISGVVVLFAFPFVRGYGRIPDNPSILPRNYGQGLAIVLVAVWIGVVAGTALAVRVSRRGPG